MDSNISELVVKSNPGVSDVFKQLEKTIDTIEKDISIPIPFLRRRNDKPSIIHPSESSIEDPTTTTGRPTVVFEATPEIGSSQTSIDRNVAPPKRTRFGVKKPVNTQFEIQHANEDELEGVNKQRNNGPNEINAPKI